MSYKDDMIVGDYNIIQNFVAALYRLWRLKLVVFIAAFIGFLGSIIYLTVVDQNYSFYSRATIYSAVYGSYSESLSGISVMNTYSGILGSSRVCDRAAAEINNSSISSEYLQNLVNSGNVYLSGASTDSKKYGYRLMLYTRLSGNENVVEITNAMANAFASEINELLGEDIIQVFDKANEAYMSAMTSNRLIIAVGVVACAFVSALLIFAFAFFSPKIYIVSQCSMNKEEILGILPRI